jgi:mannose-6-phosphate isomerase-like protein (cupin superfamily)
MIYSAMHMLQEGGDAPLHLHAAMDQVWFVIQGSAVFQDEHGNTHQLNQFEGICVPRGTAYGYRKDGPSPLLLLQFVGLNAKAKRNTLKFLGVKSNADVQDVTSARTDLYDAMAPG